MNELPENSFEDGIICQEGFSEDPDFEPKELYYLILLRTKAVSERDAHRHIRFMLEDYGLSSPHELLTLPVKTEEVTKFEKEGVGKLEEGDVLCANGFFVGFKRDCPEAREEAISLMKGIITGEE